MSVTMKVKGAQLTVRDLITVESRLGITLPKDYREFLLRYNVAVPEHNSFDGGLDVGVTSFFGISSNELDDLIKQNSIYAGRMPANILAIADGPCGNLICLDLETGAVYWWDNEQEAAAFGEDEPTFDNMELLAASFPEFLQRLEPFDPDSVPFDPSQVISVEISPEAREKFKKYFKKQK